MAKEKTIVKIMVKDIKSIRKPSGIKNDGTPNASWKKFQQRLDNYDSIPVQQWKPDNFLGYILKRYKDNYNINYTLSYSGPPTKCSEIYCVKRMMSFLGGENPDPLMVKDYIDWVYGSVIIPKKMQIESIALFFTSTLIREFKSKYSKIKKITRSTEIPIPYVDIIRSSGYDDIVTYGDLAFIKMALEQDSEYNQEYRDLFSQLSSKGFDFNKLETLE